MTLSFLKSLEIPDTVSVQMNNVKTEIGDSQTD